MLYALKLLVTRSVQAANSKPAAWGLVLPVSAMCVRSYFEIGLFDYQENGEDLLIGKSILDLEDRPGLQRKNAEKQPHVEEA